jgi:hypothetical protein
LRTTNRAAGREAVHLQAYLILAQVVVDITLLIVWLCRRRKKIQHVQQLRRRLRADGTETMFQAAITLAVLFVAELVAVVVVG